MIPLPVILTLLGHVEVSNDERPSKWIVRRRV